MKMRFDALLETMLDDPEFARGIMSDDPKAALDAKGVESTPRMVESLKAMDWDKVNAVRMAFFKGAGGKLAMT